MNWYEFKNEKPKLMINLMGKTIGQLNSWWPRIITTDHAEDVIGRVGRLEKGQQMGS